jgi:hypothetical protein
MSEGCCLNGKEMVTKDKVWNIRKEGKITRPKI